MSFKGLGTFAINYSHPAMENPREHVIVFMPKGGVRGVTGTMKSSAVKHPVEGMRVPGSGLFIKSQPKDSFWGHPPHNSVCISSLLLQIMSQQSLTHGPYLKIGSLVLVFEM